MRELWRVDWWESERGYGQKHFHYTYHKSKEAAEKYCKEEMGDRSGPAPEWYTFVNSIDKVYAEVEIHEGRLTKEKASNLFNKTKVIDRFVDEYAFLSNFYHSYIEFLGYTYPTVEHAYQAAKSTDSNDWEIMSIVDTPGKAKRLGRVFTLREDWENVKEEIMYACLIKKFEDADLCQKLLDTGEAELIEGNNWGDTYWGVDKNYGGGKNRLGELLMKLREELRVLG